MRILLKTLAAVLILLVLLIAVVLFLPDKQYQGIAQMVVKQLTDRTLSINQLKTVRSLNPSIEINDFSYANPGWAKNPFMIEAENLYISVDLKQLIEGKLHVNDFKSKGLNVDLIKNVSGDANWVIFENKEQSKRNFNIEELTKIAVKKFDLDDAQFDYRDEVARLQYRLELPSMFITQDIENKLQKVEAKGVFNDLPFSINGQSGLIQALISEKSIPFNLDTQLNQSNVSLEGNLENKTDGFFLTSNVSAQTPSLADLSVFTVNDLPSIGPINISADIAGNLEMITQKGIDISELDIKVDDPSMKLDINGNLSGLAAKNQGNVNIDLDVSDLSKLSKLFGLKKDLPGTLKLTGHASGEGENFALQINKATLDSQFLNAELTGTINDLLNGAQASIAIDLQAPNLSLVTHLYDRPMPEQWGPISASAKLTGGNKRYSLVDIKTRMSGESKVNATGEINNLLKFEKMALDVEATLASLSEISTFTPSELPDIGPMTANGKINWQEGLLSLDDAVASYSGKYGSADVSGRIGNLIKFDIVRLKADAQIPNLDIAEVFSGVKMPEIGKIKATANLVSPTPLDLSAKDLQASYEQDGISVTAVGAINSMIKKRADLNLDVSAKLKSLASLNTLLNTKLPIIGPITADAKILGAKKNIEINNVKALLSDSALYGSVDGDVGKVFDFKGIDLKTDLTTPSIQQFFSRLNLESDVKKHANFTSHIKYQEGAIHFRESELDVAGNKIIGDVSLLNKFDPSKRPKFSGQVNILNFDIPDLLGKKEKKPKKLKNSRLISDHKLPFGFLKDNDLNLNINIGHLRGDIFDFSNSRVAVKSNDGIFLLGPFKGTLGGGEAIIQLDSNVNISPPVLSFHASVQGFDMAQAGVFRDSEMIERSGDAYLFFTLNSEGKSLAAILANADGGGSLYFDDLLLKKGTLGLFSSDVFRQTLDAINPFRKKDKDTQIECSAFAFQIEDGLLTTPYGVAADATDYSLTGKGTVNFKNEDINLEFKTKPKKGLGLGFGMISGLVQVKGTLGEPVVTFNPKGIFELGATVGAAIATGGLSLLAQGQLEKLQAKSESCARALGQGQQQ